jgi:hypothetical protein
MRSAAMVVWYANWRFDWTTSVSMSRNPGAIESSKQTGLRWQDLRSSSNSSQMGETDNRGSVSGESNILWAPSTTYSAAAAE